MPDKTAASKTETTAVKKGSSYIGSSWVGFCVLLLCVLYRNELQNYYTVIPECPESLGLEDENNLAMTGLHVMRGAIPPEEVAVMREYVQNISLPTRYLCGASDYQSKIHDECSIHPDQYHQLIPQTYTKLQSKMNEWANRTEFAVRSGLCRKENCGVGNSLQMMNSEFIQISGWKFPYTLLNGPWDLLMDSSIVESFIFGKDTRGLHRLRATLTQYLNMTVYQGFHGWHVDGNMNIPGTEIQGRGHKLFIMVDKSTDPKERVNSNLVVIPGGKKTPRMAIWKMEEWMQKTFGWKPSRGSLMWGFLKELTHSSMRQTVQCKVVQDPGDVLFFRQDIMHRTQNMKTSRVSLAFNVWTEI